MTVICKGTLTTPYFVRFRSCTALHGEFKMVIVIVLEMLFGFMLIGWIISSCMSTKDKSQEIRNSHSEISKLKKKIKGR
ncbi:LapA family protein [Salmonella enterica]|nr:LapA family protein [Salmonella enterica]